MPLHLRIENETSLPDGGPISYVMQSSRGGINIGRDQYLDWVLPDTTRFISGTHCEIRYRNGQYWLQDVSTNGTFLNGSEFRVAGQHALRSGDRLEIGRYIVAVEIEGEPNLEPARDLAAMNRELPADSPQVWHIPDHDAPTPTDPRELDHRRSARAINASSFLDWMADLPVVQASPAAQPAPPAQPPIARPSAPPAPAGGSDWLQTSDMWGSAGGDANRPPPPPPASASGSSLSWDALSFEPAPAAQAQTPVSEPSYRPGAGLPPASVPAAWDQPAATGDEAWGEVGWDQPAAIAAAPARTSETPPAASHIEQAQPGPSAWPVQAPPVAPSYAPPSYAPSGSPDGYERRRDTGSVDFMERFARGARLPRDAIRAMDPGDFAEMVGELVMLTVENLRQLQLARAQFKGKIRSANHTLIGPLDNNPLRFSPSADAAMRIMFGPRQEGYLDAVRSIDSAFGDIKQHQVDTVGALQNAVRQALGSVGPKAVEAALPPEKGVGNLLGTRKARLWEKYCDVWKAQFGEDEEAALESFLRLFANAYDGRK